MNTATRRLAGYIKEKGFTITAISMGTGISYGKLDKSLNPEGKRELRADEYLAICGFIEKNPMDFYSAKESA